MFPASGNTDLIYYSLRKNVPFNMGLSCLPNHMGQVLSSDTSTTKIAELEPLKVIICNKTDYPS